jgi:hypothetical protein
MDLSVIGIIGTRAMRPPTVMSWVGCTDQEGSGDSWKARAGRKRHNHRSPVAVAHRDTGLAAQRHAMPPGFVPPSPSQGEAWLE